ncbi:MAG: Lrp/AsnC family transcriptional regulator [Clostridiales bacterium]|nr:Lrp/AsnC family transcriptional regulator [Clostridiales bacterium]
MEEKLLQLLSSNSGFTTAEIATMLGEPEDYIKAQIKEYENRGIIKGYQAVINWEKVEGTYVEALIELKVTPKMETGFDEMAELCMAFDEVESVYLMAGAYDFALIVKGETMQDIAMFVAKKLSTVDGVLSTATHFIMRRYKDRGMNLTASEECEDGRNLIL